MTQKEIEIPRHIARRRLIEVSYFMLDPVNIAAFEEWKKKKDAKPYQARPLPKADN